MTTGFETLSYNYAETRLLNEKKFNHDFSEFIKNRQIILQAIYSSTQKIEGYQFTAHIKQMYLIAQFIQGADISFQAITQGLYPQAANLQKQQIETITALIEINKNRRKDGYTPNVQNHFKSFKFEYNELNNLSHPCNEEIVEGLAKYSRKSKQGPTLHPQYNSAIAYRLARSHCLCLVHCFNHCLVTFRATFPNTEFSDEISNVKAILKNFPRPSHEIEC